MSDSTVSPSRWFEEPELTWHRVLGQGLSIADLMAPERQFSLREVDPSSSDLVEEFARDPLGPHSPELQELLNLMRTQDHGGRYVLLHALGPDAWRVVRVRRRGEPPELMLDVDFKRRESAEWAVFALRWHDHTGQSIDPMRLGA